MFQYQYLEQPMNSYLVFLFGLACVCSVCEAHPRSGQSSLLVKRPALTVVKHPIKHVSHLNVVERIRQIHERQEMATRAIEFGKK
jgi:hypothetical protein